MSDSCTFEKVSRAEGESQVIMWTAKS